MKKPPAWLLLLCVLVAIVGWYRLPSVPTYGGLSIEGFNYTPYNLDRFVITDDYGDTAGGGGDLMPGDGQGTLSCCYKLKGTDFTVKWDVYDADEAMKDLYAPIKMIHKTTLVHLPPTKIHGGAGERVLGLHFYPDDHIEFEFRNDMQGTRLFYADVWDWLRKTHNNVLNPSGEDDSVVFRKAARLAAAGWVKYHLADTSDLEQYVYFTLLNPKFDEDSAIQKILHDTKDKPGAFGAAMEKLPQTLVDQLKSGNFERVHTEAIHG